MARAVDSIDPLNAKFEGWICIRGLPFHLWNLDTFRRIGSSYGGLLEIHEQTIDYSVLTEAKIKVQTTCISEISQVDHQKLDCYWLTLQITLQFSVSSNHLDAGAQLQKVTQQARKRTETSQTC